jgi:hypothetical protein
MNTTLRYLRFALPLFAATAFVLATESASAASPRLFFNAVVTTGHDVRFVLISATGQSSGWIRLGDTFDGAVLKSFDPATSTLEIEENGKAEKLLLVADAEVKDAPLASANTARATLADAENVLQAMRFEELMAKMLEQQKKQMRGMAQQMAAQMKTPGVNSDEVVAFQQKVMDEVMGALNIDELKKDMAHIYTDVFTKDELEAQTAFYLTPAGQSLVSKTPEVQARLQAVIAPRVQAAMPKVMQMAQQFRAEQQAKATTPPASPTPTAVAAPAAPKG